MLDTRLMCDASPIRSRMTDPWHSVDETGSSPGIESDTPYNSSKCRRMPANKVGRVSKNKAEELNDWIKSADAAYNGSSELQNQNGSATISASHTSVVPGLEENGKFLARLSARSALYTDFELLLRRVTELLPGADYRRLVVDENVLNRDSSAARLKLFKELKGRYLLDKNMPLFSLFWEERQKAKSDQERALTTYVLLALNDRTAAFLSMQWLFPRLRAARSELRLADLEAHLRTQAARHPEIGQWTFETLRRVARHYLASIRDFGLAQGTVRKVAIRPALYPSPVRLLLMGLRLHGTSSQRTIHHPVFRILGIAEDEVIDVLSELNRQRALKFRMQADVIELEF